MLARETGPNGQMDLMQELVPAVLVAASKSPAASTGTARLESQTDVRKSRFSVLQRQSPISCVPYPCCILAWDLGQCTSADTSVSP